MLPDFSTRNNLSERMEDPQLGAEKLTRTLDDLAALNAKIGGLAPSIDGVEALVGRRQKRLSILDVGTGDGAAARRFVQWGRDHGIDVRVTGIDLSKTTVEHARFRCADCDAVTLEHGDLFEIDDDRSFDIVHAALMLHHLDGQRAVAGLQKMYNLSRRGVVINDLHRHPAGYYGSHILLRLLTDNPIIHHDGPVSMLRGFRRDELLSMARRIKAPVPRIQWWSLFRWQMIINH